MTKSISHCHILLEQLIPRQASLIERVFEADVGPGETGRGRGGGFAGLGHVGERGGLRWVSGGAACEGMIRWHLSPGL